MFPLFLVMLLIVPTVAKAKCEDYDIKKISGCSSPSFPFLYIIAADDFGKDMFERFNDSQRVEHLCMDKEEFDTCIKKDDPTIMSKCLNVETAQKFPFEHGKNTARRLISYYYQLGYICDEKNSWALEQKECVINALKACESVYPKMCHNVPTYLDCVRNTMIDKCNSAMTCYAQKFAAFQSCYNVADCDMCYSLGSTTNRITTLCYEDTRTNNIDNTTSTISTTKSTTFPSSTTSTTTATTTTTITTTTTAAVNSGLQNAISFVQLLAAFAIAFY